MHYLITNKKFITFWDNNVIRDIQISTKKLSTYKTV